MKKLIIALLAASALCLLLSPNSFARQGISWRGGGGWGMGSPYSRMFNPSTIDTVLGEVLSVDTITPMKGMSYGVHLLVKVDRETLSVHLGPAWYVENQDMKIEPKEKIEVVGSRVTFGGKPAIIAAEVRKGSDVLELRDKNGFPLWSGWRRR